MSSNTTVGDVSNQPDFVGRRSIITISWSCVAIIFACTWTAVHPNIPPPHVRSSKWRLLKRRIFITIWAILVPELMVQTAVYELLVARRISRVHDESVGIVKGGAGNWNDGLLHRVFAVWSGFTSIFGAKKSEQTEGVRREGEAEAEAMKASEEGRTRGENADVPWSTSVSFFFLMGGFVNGASGDVKNASGDVNNASGEANNASGDVSNASSNVNMPSGGIPRSSSQDDRPDHRPRDWPSVYEADIKDKSKGDGLAKAIVVMQTSWFLIQLLARRIEHLEITELEVMTLAYAVLTGILYGFWWNKPYNVQQPIRVSPPNRHSQSADHSQSSDHGFNFTRIILDTTIFRLHSRIIGNEHNRSFIMEALRGQGTGKAEDISLIATSVATIVFGGIHCMAWNFEFPSPAERIIWNTCSIMVTAAPIVWIVALLPFWAWVTYMDTEPLQLVLTLRMILKFFLHLIFILLVCVLAPLTGFYLFSYFICRLILIVQAFTLLRSLSSSAAQAIEWSSFIPHI